MTVGVIGYGHIGTKVVRLLKAFGCRILVADPYVQLAADDRADGVRAGRARDACWPRATWSRCMPRVTAETTGFIDAEAFAAMKTGRHLRQHRARPAGRLRRALRGAGLGQLRGAMLETFAVEPAPPDWPLLKLPNVTLTPHIAGASVKTVTYRRRPDRRGGPPLPGRRAACSALLSPLSGTHHGPARTRAAHQDRRRLPADERQRAEPGHLRQHQRPLGRRHAGDPDRRAL